MVANPDEEKDRKYILSKLAELDKSMRDEAFIYSINITKYQEDIT